MSEVVQHQVVTKSEVSLNSLIEDGWMNILWRWADDNNISGEKLPREKKKLLHLRSLELFSVFFHMDTSRLEGLSGKEYDDKLDSLFSEAMDDPNPKAYLPKELCMLCYLEELCITFNSIRRLPDEITQLRHLKKLCLCYNFNLVLTEKQKEWARTLEINGAIVQYDDGLLDYQSC